MGTSKRYYAKDAIEAETCKTPAATSASFGITHNA